ncbi:GNAT family N-acetyltransferase [Cesiribacter andamanensis]|uniref:Putative acetyltransferase n=1 Tax=Cesiribacter andamanensis AMV16 TaxID=1279009 RepID=M7NXA9_9BACT|nr:GNAT family N-acetyltransferase [Cesiribacter andamanensis]EMR03074.1 putative acetyltransferase [Cesiribacter andamanensis AMV16]
MNRIIKRVGPQEIEEFTALIKLFEEVFELPPLPLPATSYLQQLLLQESFHVFVAMEGSEVIGGLTAFTLPQYHSTAPLLYVYDLAVAPSRQRQGIGRELMATAIAYAREKGMEEVFVQAEEEDLHALDFYRATDAQGQRIFHFTYPLLSTKGT